MTILSQPITRLTEPTPLSEGCLKRLLIKVQNEDLTAKIASDRILNYIKLHYELKK